MKRRNRSSAAGFTLMELVVAMGVGVVVAAAVTSGFLSLNRLMYTQEGIRAGQASLRQSLALLTRQLRSAGYGLEPRYAFDFPTSPSWSNKQPDTQSDELKFRSRDPAFARKIQLSATSVSTTTLFLGDPVNPALPGKLNTTLRKGQIVQIMCPGGVRWTYGRLALQGNPNDATLTLEAPGTTFPNLNADLAMSCYKGIGTSPGMIFKIDEYDYEIQLIEDDGVAATPKQPFLFRNYGVAGVAKGEPIADNIEALRVAFIRRDLVTGKLKVFTPDPLAQAPTYESAKDALERNNDNGANAVAIRIQLVARASVRDQKSADTNDDAIIPAFTTTLGNKPEILLTKTGTYPAVGYRRVTYETTVPLRNMHSISMPTPPLTTYSSACSGPTPTAPADGLNCFSG